ncbi:MAG: ubiquinone biosynthesis protein UbiE [Oscillospiraceae bacterium]|nr:ubiquinone biosynthesis protein UbiE [Oscillospiraceae bacterium]
MEAERFFTGYCRQTDGPRTVMAVAENGTLSEVDCLYEHCPYAADCPIGKDITDFLEQL